MIQRITAGELSKKAFSDTTKYNALEVGHALADDIGVHLRQCIENHKNIILEPEFCIVMIIATDPLIKNLQRRKFYAWPYLPSPRPNQSVFLYNKAKDDITKRLWVMPNNMMMAELHSLSHVAKPYQTMKAWSDAFYRGWRYRKNKDKSGKYQGEFYNANPSYFWDYIRNESGTDMLSEHEYFLLHRDELMQAGCKIPDTVSVEAFDFSKIAIEKIVDTQTAMID